MQNFKSDFPIFNTYPDLVYLDSGATSQKPREVIEAVSGFYSEKNANIHRGIYKLAEMATAVYENGRRQTSELINAKSKNEIIFTGNTNQAINLVAYGWGRKFLRKGDVILLSEMEHHANIVPWLRLKEEIGVELIFLPINKEFRLDYKIFDSEVLDFGKRRDELAEKVKLVALTQASNVLGTVNPLEEIILYFKKNGLKAKVLVDAAQSAPHLQIDVQKSGIDFLAFSAHKMLGPTGVGVLWAKEDLLDAMDPMIVGSNMIESVSKESVTWAGLPEKFEAGTGNLEGVAGWSAAISYLQKIGWERINSHEDELVVYGLRKLLNVPYIKLYGPVAKEQRLGIFSFGIEGAHPHDIAQILDDQNIAIRSGHHCAQITMKALNLQATARASLYLYNSKEDIDRLIEALGKVKKTLRI